MSITPAPRKYAANEWLLCIRSWPKSRILYRIKGHILAITAWTAALCGLILTQKLKFEFPFFVHTVTGSVLSLLLVFKTNASYDRFWEGRKLWGAVVGACRNYARIASVYLDKDTHTDVLRLLVAFSTSLHQHIQGVHVNSQFSRLLNEQDILRLGNRKHRPLAVANALEEKTAVWLASKYADNPTLGGALGAEMRLYISTLVGSLGASERIVKSPAPYLYSINTSRFLSLYLFTLPLAIIPFLGWFSVPVMAAVSWCFISVQEIGHFIEDPFNADMGQSKTELIPMKDLTALIETNIQGISS
jgi:putative membrane protein